MRTGVFPVAASLAVLCLLLAACSGSGRVPGDVIPIERMGVILYDIGLSEAHMENYYFKDSTRDRDSMLVTELEKVLAIHGVSAQEFRESYAFYKSRPQIFKVMVDTLQSRAQRSQDKMYGKRPRPQVK